MRLTSVDAVDRRFLYQTLPGWLIIDIQRDAYPVELSSGPWSSVTARSCRTSRMQVVAPTIASGTLLVPDTSPFTQAATSTLQTGDAIIRDRARRRLAHPGISW